MANELTVNASLTYADGAGVRQQLQMLGLTNTPSVLKPSRTTQTINTSETAVNLGDTAAPGYALVINRSAHAVDLKVAASGAIFAHLDAVNADGNGGVALLKLGSGAQAPVAVATGSAAEVEVFVIPA